MHTYKAEVKDGKIHVTADLRKVESKKGRRPTRDVKAQAKKSTEEETVVVIGGGSAGAGVVEGLREVRLLHLALGDLSLLHFQLIFRHIRTATLARSCSSLRSLTVPSTGPSW